MKTRREDRAELLLDTHIWVRSINCDPELPVSLIAALENGRAEGRPFVSVISIWEVAMLVQKGRLTLPLGVDGWVNRALELPGVNLLPFSPTIAMETARLPKPMHKDPADRILVASARVERLRLVSLDRAVIAFARLTNLSYLTA